MLQIPNLVIFGQITVDDVVPATPGIWRRLLGGNALYAAAGARLVLSSDKIGIVSRIGRTTPINVRKILDYAGIRHSISSIENDILNEWILYEEDGSRFSIPRNISIRRSSSEKGINSEAYRHQLEAQSPTLNDMPPTWINATGFHLSPQVLSRHKKNFDALKGNGFISLDPSPHYVCGLSSDDLFSQFQGVSVFMPSEQEIKHLTKDSNFEELKSIAAELYESGFTEVIVKVGAKGCLVAGEDGVRHVPSETVSKLVDSTGAGDAFCGAYTACRIQGISPIEAASIAVKVGRIIVQSAGVEEALKLPPNSIFGKN